MVYPFSFPPTHCGSLVRSRSFTFAALLRTDLNAHRADSAGVQLRCSLSSATPHHFVASRLTAKERRDFKFQARQREPTLA